MKPRNTLVYEAPGGAAGGTAVVPSPAAPPPAPDPDPAPLPASATAADQSVYAQMQTERKRRQETEAKLKALEAAQEAARVAELSDNERLKVELAAAAAERDTLKGQVTLRDKGDLIRRAAKDYADPEDAVALLRSQPATFDAITTDTEAAAAVKALAVAKPHLLRVAGAPNLTAPGIERVLGDGLVVPAVVPAGTLADDGRTLTHAELKGLSSAQMEDLRVNHPKTYERSFKALKKP